MTSRRRFTGCRVVVVAVLIMATAACSGTSSSTSSETQTPDADLLLAASDFPVGYDVFPATAGVGKQQLRAVDGRIYEPAECAEMFRSQAEFTIQSQRSGVVAVNKDQSSFPKYSDTVIRNAEPIAHRREVLNACGNNTATIPGQGTMTMTSAIVDAPADLVADDALVFSFSTTFQPEPDSTALRSKQQTVIGYADLPGLQVEFYQEVDGLNGRLDTARFDDLFVKAVNRASIRQ